MTLQQVVKRQLQLIQVEGANPGAQFFMVNPNGEDYIVDLMTLEAGNIYLYPREINEEEEGPVPQPADDGGEPFGAFQARFQERNPAQFVRPE